MKLFDVVALTEDLSAHGLRKGQVGTIVELLDESTFEVEFSDNTGHVYKQAPIKGTSCMVLTYSEIV